MFVSLLTLAFLSSSNAYRLAQQVSQKRAQYEGGWALGLAGSTCPSEAPVACDTNAGSVNPTCCPQGQTCFGLVNPHCCPSNSDCVNVVENLPMCANSTWNMYLLGDKNNFFCCEPGQFGVLPLAGYAGVCEPNDVVVASTLLASLASQAGGTASPPSASKTRAGNAPATTSNPSSATSGSSGSGSSGSGSTGSGNDGSGSSSASNGGNGHFPKGAIIGIAVAGLAAVIFAGLFLWKCCTGRQRNAAASVEPYRSQGYLQPTYQETPPAQYGGPAREYKEPELGGKITAYNPRAQELAQEWNGRAEMGPGRE